MSIGNSNLSFTVAKGLIDGLADEVNEQDCPECYDDYHTLVILM